MGGVGGMGDIGEEDKEVQTFNYRIGQEGESTTKKIQSMSLYVDSWQLHLS